MLNDKQVYPSTAVPDTNGYEYIDFGLPSGNLWAVKNIGAEQPWEPGTYFQFGDPVGYKSDSDILLSPDQHKWKNNYPNQKLNPEDDPAHVAMGGDWYTPTKEDFKELFDYLQNSHSMWTLFAYDISSQRDVGLQAGFNIPYPNDPNVMYTTDISQGQYLAEYMQIQNSSGTFYLPASGYRALSKLYYNNIIFLQCSEKYPSDNTCWWVKMDEVDGRYMGLYQYAAIPIRPVCKK